MANQLKMAKVHAIRVLRERGWSYRRIARELGIHRETVARYLALARGSPSKPAKVITGSESSDPSESAQVITGDHPGGSAVAAGDQDPPPRNARLPDRPESFPQGVQRGGLPPDGRAVHPLPRECLLVLQRRAPDAGDRQPQGGREPGGLVRPRADAEDSVVLRTLRNADPAHPAENAPAQGQDRAQRGVREEQRPQGPNVREPGRREPAPARMGEGGCRPADPRHDPAAGQEVL